jgi:hypothetical protein
MHNLGCIYVNDRMKAPPSSNVISLMLSTTLMGGMINGFTCMSKVFINVYYVFSSKMMIWANDVFELLRGNISMEPIDCMGMCWLETVGACIACEGCIKHLNKVVKSCHVWICITIVKHLNLPNYRIKKQSWKWNLIIIKRCSHTNMSHNKCN